MKFDHGKRKGKFSTLEGMDTTQMINNLHYMQNIVSLLIRLTISH